MFHSTHNNTKTARGSRVLNIQVLQNSLCPSKQFMFVTLQLTVLEILPSKGKCRYQSFKQVKLVFMAEMYLAVIGTALMRLLWYKAEHAGFKKVL